MSAQEYSLWLMIKDIWKYVKPYKKRFFLGVFFRATSDIANFAPAVIYSWIITILASTSIINKWEQIPPMIIVWIVAIYYYRVGHDCAKYFGYMSAQYAGLDAKFAALQHLFVLDLDWHEKENSGNKIKKIDNANKAIKESVSSVFNVLIENIVSIVGVCVVFLTVDKNITIIFVVYMTIFIILSRYMSLKVSKRYRPISHEEETYEGLSFEAVNNIRTVKSLILYKPVSINIKSSINRLKEYIQKFIFISRIRNHLLDSITRIMEFTITIYLVYRITQNIEAIGALVLFRSLFWKVIEAIWEFTEIYNELLINKVYMGRFAILMNAKPTIENQVNQIEFPKNWKEFEIKDLSFSYGDKEVLKNLNLTIQKGEKIGIVGISGAGKSTFVKLVLDLYEDYEGSIGFDGISLKSIKRDDYINYVSNVSQDTELFNDSLRDNILIGINESGNLTNERLKNAIKLANLDDVISKLPEGAETLIGEKGFKLSGGERQRVGIARAIIRNPQIIVLDEATSHLDSESEHKIQTALDEVFSNVTAIVIAHRLSTLRKMDRIVVLNQGELVEEGTLKELIDKNGLFTKFWNKQNSRDFD
jgi:ABC-type multidrug transport system fused ATPase/permease subunit